MRSAGYELPQGLDQETRKDTGAFYTPPEIVDFMVEELLRGRKEPLSICDAACGGGAFLEGVLRYVRKNEPAKYKSYCQKLYGIDINPKAVELARKNLPDLPEENLICADTLELDFTKKPYDIIIGNPPYLCGGLKNNPAFSAERQEKLKKRFPESFEYKMNLFALFIEQSSRMADEFMVIVPDSLLCGRYFSRLRRYLTEKWEIKLIALLEKPGFDAAPGNGVIFQACKKEKEGTKGRCVLIPPGRFEKSKFQFHSFDQKEFLKEERCRFQLCFSETEEKIISKIKRGGTPLKEEIRFASGIIARGGKKSIIKTRAAEGCEPGIIYGREIKPFEVHHEGAFIDLKPEKIKSGLKHERYCGEKIFLRQTGSRLIAAVSREKMYALNNCHIGTAKGKFPVETVAALLNSEVMNFYYEYLSGENNKNFAQIDIDLLNHLPLRRSEEFDRFAKKCTSSPEARKELDKRCADLYGLTGEELAFIKK